MESDTPARDPNDINQTAAYAAAMQRAGGRLNLTPKAPREDAFAKTPVDESEELATWYQMNADKGIDLSSPDAKEHWQKIVTGINKRHTDWGETISEVGGMIAKLPADLLEGMAEDPNPLVWGASVGEGVVRSLRDMWGMVTESENPTSPVFHLRSLIRAVKSGKISQNWEEEAQQWNESRKFLWDSQKIMQGDMSVYETLPYVNMSEATAQKLRSFSNPKVAHAMSFLGLEVGSIAMAPFTGGASQALAIGTAVRAGRAGAMAAEKMSFYGKAMGTLTEAGKKLDALAAGATQRAVGHLATGLSKAISIPANAVEGLVGGTIQSVAARSGYGAEHIRNIAATQAINGMADIGAGEIRQTVGYLGSLGLRTTAELLGEVGEQSLNLAHGMITADQVNGLTVLERMASSKTLSPSASKAAKALNVIVDPMLQMSTAAMKHAYKDSLLFAGLGYMNDRERGAVSGATMGMVWGGYSGAVRHMWGNVNGFVQHENFIKDFDNNFLPKLDGFSPEFAEFARAVTKDADLSKSSRVSSNVRVVLQMAHTILDPKQKKGIIASTKPAAEMMTILSNRGVKDPARYLDPRGRGQFTLVPTNDGMMPMLWLNPDLYRPADFGHEALGHMLIYTLHERGQMGTHLLEFFGTGVDKGVWSDKYMAETAALRNSLEMAMQQIGEGQGIEGVRALANKIYHSDAGTEGSVAFFAARLKALRDSSYGADFAFFNQQDRGQPSPFRIGEIASLDPNVEANMPLRYIFEEMMSGHAENMFIHTNLQDLNIPADQKPLRMYFERKFLERLSRVTTELEMAGVRAKYGAPLGKDNRPSIQAEVYDDGIYRRAPQMDNLLRNMVDAAKNTNDAPVQNLSPEMQLAVAKKHRKEHLFNIRGTGATLKGEKERNEMSTKSSKGAFDIIDQLPDELKPKITLDEHGNRTADVYTMKDEVLDSLADSGFLDPESVRVAKAFRDTYMAYESSGFTSGNMFYGQNLGSSHRTAVGNLFKRIFGEDVPVTHRVFVPFELKLYYRTTDGTGKQLRQPRGGYVATVMDYTAVHRREMKMWSRPDVKALFSGLQEFNEFFHVYMMNMLREPSARVDSASLFKPKFGANAEKVRDIMYETFGASKRADESYINPPREGYFSSHENPNFPIHSLRLENLVGVERVAAAPFPYHHGRSYEPLRRNLSVAGFEEISANMFASGQGYRVMRERPTQGSNWKVFSPFGAMIGSYKERDKAFKAAQKHLRSSMNPADVLALPTDEAWTQMNRTERLQQIQKDQLAYHQATSARAKGYLQVGPVRQGGIGISPEKIEPRDFVSLVFKAVPSKLGEEISTLYTDWKKLTKQYEVSNNLPEGTLGKLRFREDDFNKVSFESHGTPMSIEAHQHDGLPVITFDRSYFEKHSPEGAQRIFHQMLESHAERIARAFNPENAGMSFWTKTSDANALELRGQNLQIAEATKALFDHVSGKGELPPEYKKAMEDTIASTEWCSDKKEPRWEQLKKSKSEFETARLWREIIELRGHTGVFGLFAKAFGGNVNQPRARQAMELLRQLNLPDENGVVAPVAGPNGPLIHLSLNKDFKDLSIRLDKIVDGMTLSERDAFNTFAKTVFSHQIHQIYVDSAYAGIGVISKEYHVGPASPRKVKGTLKSTGTSVYPKAEAVTTGISLNDTNWVSVRVSGSGVDATTNHGSIIKMGYGDALGTNPAVRGGTELGSAFGLPKGGNMSKKTVGVAVSALPNEIGDYVYDRGMERAGILDVARDLSYDIIASSANSDQNLVKVWEQFSKTKNTTELAVALHDIALATGKQSPLENSFSLLGLAKALDPVATERRFKAKYGPKEAERVKNGGDPQLFTQELAIAGDRYWSEAVANYNTTASTLWDVGGEKTLIELHYDYGVSSQFHAKFGYDAKALEARVAKHRKIQAATHDMANKKWMSVGGVDALRPSVRDEVLRAGLAKEITIHGKKVMTFEFSDSEAYLDTSFVQNQPHLLPFAGMPDPEKAYSDYAFEVKRRAAIPDSPKYIPSHIPVGKETTLGKVFGHESMYYYYPEMRDVKVRWIDDHGAYARTLPSGESLIELGIRSFAAAELNMKNDPDGMVINDAKSLTSRFTIENPLASIILHEAQHVLQEKANMLKEDGHIFNLNKQVLMGHFANLLGIKSNFAISDVISKAMKRDAVWSDAVDTAAPDVNALADRLALAKDSPVIRHLSAKASPLMKTALRNFAAFVAHEASAGRVDDTFGRMVLDLQEAHKHAETLTEHLHAYDSMTKLRAELKKKSPAYAIKMNFDSQFRQAMNALGLVRNVVAIEHSTPTQKALLVRQALEDYTDMYYMNTPSERMARETEARRMLTQDELDKSPRKYSEDLLPEGSVMDIIDRAMAQSNVETPDSLMKRQTGAIDSYLQYSKHNPVQVIMKSIGGIASKEGDSGGYEMLGKLSLVRYILARSGDEIESLGRFSLIERGWAVEEGKLVFKTGNYIVQGDFREAIERLSNKMEGLSTRNYSQADTGYVPKEYVTPSAQRENGTYSLQDIVEIANIKITAADTLSIGNSVIDAIMDDSFPPVFKVGDVMSNLNRRGVIFSNDATTAVMLPDIVAGFGPETVMTKNDLLNILCYNHSKFSMLFNASDSGFGVNAIPDSVLARKPSSDVMRQVLAAFPSTSKSHIQGILAQRGGYSPFQVTSKEYRYGKFELSGQEIKFSVPELEAFITAPEDMVELQKIRERISSGFMATLAEHSVTLNSREGQKRANTLNERLQRLSTLIEPMLNKVFDMVRDSASGSPREKSKLAVMLLSELEKSLVRVTIVEGNRGRNSNEGQVPMMVGGHRDTLSSGYYEPTALARIHGKGSVISRAANAGGMAASRHSHTPLSVEQMHTLGTLHGGFLFGESAFISGDSAIPFERAESGLAISIGGAFDQTLSRAVINSQESLTSRDRLMQDVAVGDGVETTQSRMAKAQFNWSGEEFNVVTMRLRDHADAIEHRMSEIDLQIDEVGELRRFHENGKQDLTPYRAGGFVQKFLSEKLAQGMTAGATFDLLTSMLEAKKTVFNAQAKDMGKVFQIQLGVASKVAGTLAPITVQRTEVYVGMEAVLPHHVALRGSKREAGAAIIKVGEDSFVDVDTSLADPEAVSSATLPAFGMETQIPKWLMKGMNTNAHNLEAVVTGLIGGTIFDGDGDIVSKPSTYADHVASFIERGALPDDVTTPLPAETSTQTVISGLLFASQNTFANLSKHVPDANANFVDWALANRGPQIQADYQTGGLFGDQNISQNPLLNTSTRGINTAVLGMMVAPFILAHNNLGFPDVKGGRIVHDTKVLEVGNYHEIVAFAETADMRNPEHMVKMKTMIEEWYTQVDKTNLERIVYEASSAQAIDGTLLRLNMAQTHALSKRSQERAPEIMEAHDMGATFGFDQQYGDSGVYGNDVPTGHGTSTISYMSKNIRQQAGSVTFWRGYFMGVASLKGIKTRKPREHGWRKYGVKAHDAVAGDAWLQYDRPSMSVRRSVNLGMDINSADIAHSNEVPTIGGSFTMKKNRKSFKDLNPQARVQSSAYRTPLGEEMSVYDAIQTIATEQKQSIEGLDTEGAYGTKDVWYDINSGEGGQIVLGTDTGDSTKAALRVRKSEFSSRVRREIIVNRLANLASQLGTSKLAVQPARFSSARKPSLGFIGLASSDTRAGHFNNSSTHSIAWSGQPFVSAMSAERDKPRVGFAWSRLEDGRIMVNLAPDINLGSYLDAVPADRYIAPLGFSHRRSLGWDSNTKTLIPMALGRMLGMQDAIGDNGKAMRTLDRRIAHTSDLLHPASLKQYELAAKSVAKRALLGRLTSEIESAEFTRKITQFGYGSNAIKNVRENGRALDFSEFVAGNEEHVKQLLDLNDLMRTSSPEHGYHTIILPKHAGLDLLQSAYFTLVAYHSESLRTNDRVGAYARNGNYRYWAGGPTGDSPYFGHIDEFGGITGTARNTFLRALASHREMRGESYGISSGKPSLVGYSLEGSVDARGPSNFAKEIEQHATRASFINPDLIRDLTGAHERMLGAESGYFMPDVERAFAMNGDRSAVIDLLMPDSKHLQRFAWDDVKKNNVTVIRKSDKSGFMVGHDVVTGVDTSGMPVKTRKVMAFRIESEALAYRDSVMSGGVEAEVPSMLFKEGGYAMKTLDQKYSHAKTSGKANITKGQQVSDAYVAAEAETTMAVYTHDGFYHVGNIDTPFTTLPEAKAAQEMLLRVETITGNAPKVERINLSTGGVGMYEHDIRRGLQFGIGGSPYQFAPRALNVLRTGLVPMLERNASGATRKVKKAVEVAKGGEWYEMFMENSVSKNEMRVLGLADFLHDNRDNKLTKTEVAKFLWAMYPVTGRRSDQLTKSPYVASVNSPEAAIRSTARRFHEERMRQVKEIEDAIETTPEEEKGVMVAYLATIRKMHDDALQSALEQFYEKDTAVAIIGNVEKTSVIDAATTGYPPANVGMSGRNVPLELSGFPHVAITPAVLETYRSVFNDAFAKAKLEAASRVAGFDFEIPDFRSNSVPVDLIMDWGQETSVTSKRTGTSSKDTVGESAKTAFNMQIQDGHPDYGNYTSGIGSYRWDTLHTGMGLSKADTYLSSLKELFKAADTAEEQSRIQMQMDSLSRIIRVKRVAESRMSGTGHKSTPSSTMQLGHARHSDVIVTAYHRANAPLSELSNSLMMKRDTMAVLGIEELQSDRYQSSTFGPMIDSYLGSSFEQVEGGKLLTELTTLRQKIEQEELKQGHLSAPMEAVQSSVKQKHTHNVYALLAAREMEKASPLLKYILFSQLSESERDAVALDHSVKHPITKETAEKYGIKENYVPEVKFTVGYNGILHSSLRDLIALSHSEGGSNMQYSGWLVPYGFGPKDKQNGLMPMSQTDYIRYNDNPSPDNAGRLIASFGLQFNTEFMSRLDELGQWYEIDGDLLGTPHGVDFDRIAMETVLDYKRRLGRSDVDPRFKRQALRIMTSLEQLYYEKGDGIISDFRTKWSGVHSERNKVANLSDLNRGEDMTAKRPYSLYNSRLWNIAENPDAHVPSLVNKGLTNKDSAVANATEVARRTNYSEKKFLELSPVRALAFDIRLRSKILGVTPEQYLDALAWNLENGEGKVYQETTIQTMRDSISDPESVTHNRLSNIGDRCMLFVQSMDIDFDGADGNPVGRNRGVHEFKAQTVLGRIFEGVAPQVTATYLANKPNVLLDGYRAKVFEIEAKIGKVADADTYTYPDLIPLGEDGAYRGTMTSWYAMRALQSRKDAITVMDARHHRTRYDSVGNTVGMFNLGNGIIAPINIAGSRRSTYMASAYIMDVAKKEKAHGGLIDAMHAGLFPDAVMYNDAELFWNGKSAKICRHLEIAAEEIIQQLPFASNQKTKESMIAEVKTTIQTVFLQGPKLRSDTSLKDLVTKVRSKSITREVLEADISGAVTDGKDVIRRIATHHDKPQGFLMSIPVGRTHGYATNYGAPLWHNRIYYAGMHEGLINQVSHDAFDIPEISMVNGEYVVTDKKTGKPIAQGIKSFDEAQERAAQSAKYLGAVPIVSNFLKTFGRMGAYAMEGFMLTGAGRSDSFKIMHQDIADDAVRPVSRDMATAAGVGGIGELTNKMGASFGTHTPTADTMGEGTLGGLTRSEAVHGLFGPNANVTGAQALDHATALHSIGLRLDSSPEAVAAAMHRMTSFTGPLLVIRPKFPTANHKAEAKKAIVNGIPFMSVKGVDKPETLAKSAVGMYNWYAGAKQPQQDDER
jgi:hypothetical protein